MQLGQQRMRHQLYSACNDQCSECTHEHVPHSRNKRGEDPAASLRLSPMMVFREAIVIAEILQHYIVLLTATRQTIECKLYWQCVGDIDTNTNCQLTLGMY
jgi:hypothetical protein